MDMSSAQNFIYFLMFVFKPHASRKIEKCIHPMIWGQNSLSTNKPRWVISITKLIKRTVHPLPGGISMLTDSWGWRPVRTKHHLVEVFWVAFPRILTHTSLLQLARLCLAQMTLFLWAGTSQVLLSSQTWKSYLEARHIAGQRRKIVRGAIPVTVPRNSSMRLLQWALSF